MLEILKKALKSKPMKDFLRLALIGSVVVGGFGFGDKGLEVIFYTHLLANLGYNLYIIMGEEAHPPLFYQGVVCLSSDTLLKALLLWWLDEIPLVFVVVMVYMTSLAATKHLDQ